MDHNQKSSAQEEMRATIEADGVTKIQGFVTLERFFRDAAECHVQVTTEARDMLLFARNHGLLERPLYGEVRNIAVKLSRAGTVLEAQYAIGRLCGPAAQPFTLGAIIDMSVQMMHLGAFVNMKGTSLFWCSPWLNTAGLASILGFRSTQEGIIFGLHGGAEEYPTPFYISFWVPDNVSVLKRFVRNEEKGGPGN